MPVSPPARRLLNFLTGALLGFAVPAMAQSPMPVSIHESTSRSQLQMAVDGGSLSGAGTSLTVLTPGLAWRVALAPRWSVMAKAGAMFDLDNNGFAGTSLSGHAQYSAWGTFVSSETEIAWMGETKGRIVQEGRSKLYLDVGFKTLILSGSSRAYTAQGLYLGVGTQFLLFGKPWDLSAGTSSLTSGDSSLSEVQLGIALCFGFN